MMAEHFRDMSEIAKREKAKADAYRAAELRLAAHAKEHFLAQEESRANRHERRKIAAIERKREYGPLDEY